MMNHTVMERSRRTWVGATSAFVLAVTMSSAVAAPLKFTVGEEAVTDLSTFNYTGVSVAVTPTDGFLLCANTSWQQSSPTPASVRLVPTNADFEFGAVTAAGAPIVLNDVRSFRYQVGAEASVEVNKAAAPGTLGCFVTNAAGTRASWYNGLFVDGFDPAPSASCTSTSTDSCAAVHVASVATDGFGRVIYTYFVDYHLPAGVASYTLRDGYSTTKFSNETNWCATANQASTTCSGPLSTTRTIDVNLVGGGSATNGRIKVTRRGAVGVGIPAMTGTLVIAALFPEAPARSLEDRLGDNVSVGTGVISDQAPVFNLLPPSLSANKTTGLASVNFTISDDSTEVAGSLLRATANVRFGTLGSFPAAVNCGSSTPQAGQPSRTCSLSFVPPAGYTNFATATAAGVTADITLTATDTLNQSTQTAALPLTVVSTSNSIPTYLANPAPVDVGGVLTATLICNVSDLLASGSASCGLKGGPATYAGFLSRVRPGAVDSQDETALQEAFAVVGASNVLACDNTSIFNISGPPRLSPTYQLTYTPNGNPGVALCDVIVSDRMISGSFPAGQAAQTTQFKLKIEVVDDVP